MALAKSKPLSDSGVLLQGIAGLAIALLVMLGVGGSIYYLAVADRMLSVAALSIVSLCIWLSAGRRNRRPELFAYGFAAVGAVYAFQILSHGGL